MFHQYSATPRPPTYTYTNPPRLYHRQPPSPPGGSPGTSSGQLMEPPQIIRGGYDEPHTLLHRGGQYDIHAVSGMNDSMGYGSGSLNLSLPSDIMGSHQQYMSTLPSMQNAYPTSDGYRGSFPVMSQLGEALDERFEHGSAYSSSDFGSSDVGSSSHPHPTPSEYETERFLREHLNIPEPTPLNLDAIAHDNKPGIKTMIILSIWASPEKRLTLQGIYEAIETRFPHRKSANDKPWQRSIRHNLSLKAMFVFEERPTNHPGKGRYWRIDISKGIGNKRNRKRKHGKRGGRKDGDDDGEDEEEFDDEDEDEAGSRDQAPPKQYGVHSLRQAENRAGTPAFSYPDGTSFNPSPGLTQQAPPTISLTSGQNMNYPMGASFTSQLNFQSPGDFRGPFPNMNSAQFGDRPMMNSYPSMGPTYSSLNPAGDNMLRATSLPPSGPIFHPGPQVELPRRNTTGGSAPVGRHQHSQQYGGGPMVPHPSMPNFSSMQQGSNQPPQTRSPLRLYSDLSSPNTGSQDASRKRRLR